MLLTKTCTTGWRANIQIELELWPRPEAAGIWAGATGPIVNKALLLRRRAFGHAVNTLGSTALAGSMPSNYGHGNSCKPDSCKLKRSATNPLTGWALSRGVSCLRETKCAPN